MNEKEYEELRTRITNEVIAELRRNCLRRFWKAERINVYAEPKCPYCDQDRYIKATAPNGQVLEDRCRCSQKEKMVWKAIQIDAAAYSIGIPDGHAVIIPAETDYNGRVLVAYWVDPDPESSSNPPSEMMLWNSYFTTEEKLFEYCRAAGAEMLSAGMQESR